MKIYSFTVKNNSKDKWPMCSDYVEWVENARAKGFDVQFYIYEIDSKDRLHIHGIAHWHSSRLLWKKSLTYKDFHQRIDELPTTYDQQRYNDYCHKQFNNNEEHNQKILAYEIRHSEYPFQD